MALVSCSECSKKISDRASACPQCGAPQSQKHPFPSQQHPTIESARSRGASAVLDSPGRKWGLEIFGLFVGSAALTTVGSYMRGEQLDLPMLLGSSTVPFLISLVFLKRSLGAAAVAALIVVGLSQYGASQQSARKDEDRAAIVAMTSAIEQRKELAEKPLTDAGAREISQPPAAASTSPIQTVSTLVTAHQRKASILERTYTESVSALGEILTPHRLVSSEGIAANDRALTGAFSALSGYKSGSETLTRDFDAQMLALSGKPGYRNLLAGFKEGVKKREERTERFFENQHQLLSVAVELNDFMEDQLGKTEVEGDQILFASDELANHYNGLVSKIHVLASEEEELRAEQMQVLDKVTSELRKLSSER